MKPNRLITLSLSALVIGSISQAHAAPLGETTKEVVGRSALEVHAGEVPDAPTSYDLRKTSSPRKHAYPEDAFWDEVAQCETSQNWENGGKWAGGLGIYTVGKFGSMPMGTWEHFGGEEFAPSPDKATREEQIIVANRIAIGGYKTIVHRDPKWAERKGVPVTYVYEKKPAGLGGWGCFKSKHTGKYRMAKPKMYYYKNYQNVVLFAFKFNENSRAVHDLQVFLGVKVDSNYGKKTREAHIKYLKKHKLSLSGVPDINRVSAARIGDSKTK